MHPDLERDVLVQTILSFADILSSRGTPFTVPQEEELRSMGTADLIRLSKVLERVARTPL